jgi:adenylate kinase
MIVFFGPAGAGKSVQGQILAARHGWRWLSAGQLLRDTHDTSLLKKMNAGELIDNDDINKIIAQALQRAKDLPHVILDGFPRSLGQAEWLIGTKPEHDRSIGLVIVLEVPKSELLKRLLVRGRVDDTSEAVDRRLSIYRQQIYPILNYLSEQHVPIVHIDGVGSVGNIHDRIEAELESCSLV